MAPQTAIGFCFAVCAHVCRHDNLFSVDSVLQTHTRQLWQASILFGVIVSAIMA